MMNIENLHAASFDHGEKLSDQRAK